LKIFHSFETIIAWSFQQDKLYVGLFIGQYDIAGDSLIASNSANAIAIGIFHSKRVVAGDNSKASRTNIM
jgi:hypothetical protein